MTQYYDLIGDIHGYADELIALLLHLGYDNSSGYFQHPERKMIFLGDFIDRGPQQRKVLDTVMPMVASGAALAVMGNHEFNALAFHTNDSDNPDQWLRPRTDKNIQQHRAFIDAYTSDHQEDDLREVLDFFYQLPLWLELDGLRVVHACWEPNQIEYLSPLLHADNTLSPEVLVEASRKGSKTFDAIEALLKGVEYMLPDDHFFHDKDGHKRTAARTRWWHNEDATLSDIAFPPGMLEEEVGKLPVSANELVGYPDSEPPVFLGHYWLRGHPAKLADNVACLDYSVAKEGKLVAYRWRGEQTINDDHFVYVKS